jgi:hypothetical protein
MDAIPRRQALKTLGAAGAGALIGVTQANADAKLSWHDASRRLTIRLAKNSRLLPPAHRPMQIRLASPSPGSTPSREITFEGREVAMTF